MVFLFLLALFLVHDLSAGQHEPATAFPHPTRRGYPMSFSDNLSSNMVLQRAPATSAVYGTVGSTFTLPASVKVTFNGHTYTASADKQGQWKVMFPAMPAGGNFSIAAACAEGCTSPPVTLYNVTFGDVYFCSGQSNMELKLHYTFSRNQTIKDIQSGKYHNIRLWSLGAHPSSSETWVLTNTGGYTGKTWLSAQQAVDKEIETKICYDCGQALRPILMQFSAACWYFAQNLVDRLGDEIPIGLVQSAVGGTMIEAWTKNVTVSNCKENLCGQKPGIPSKDCGTLYNGMVAPFVNMTVKGFLWYQGENNVFGPPGNVIHQSGYGCMLPNMINGWRTIWSAVDGTTNPMAPFGIVMLAGGTSEGHGINMPVFQWAQTANHGVVPNDDLPNCFMAAAYDLGDPYEKDCYYKNCCRTIVPLGKGCNPLPGAPYSWDKTNFYMGPIHPRPKEPLGKRLGQAAYSIIYDDMKSAWTGPVIESCTVQGDRIMIKFNQSTLFGDLEVQKYSSVLNASGTFVCTDENLPPILPNKTQLKFWHPVDITMADSSTVAVNLSPLSGKTPTGLQYAWGDYVCCGKLDRTYTPCPPASCPIMGKQSGMPAMPFFAQIVNGKCKCFPPQRC